MAQSTCFHEADPGVPLAKRAMAEALGTLLLVLAASGAGLAGERAFRAEPGLVLPVAAIAIPGALVGLILALGAVSGGHFNPLITILQWLAGERGRICMLAYVGAQFAGGVVGGWLGAALWQAAPTATVVWDRMSLASEAIATGGLMLIVFGCSRSGRTEIGPIAVGAWLSASILSSPTTSYANPAVVAGALASAGPLFLQPGAGFSFVCVEIAGSIAALAPIAFFYPRRGEV
ncbi:aquaporin [uncultured Hyphomonas sp.]|uniref:aquaporin n=1 Tax=uncultured Hyphomonas sp. TaxID=225298 RepID=UPI002AAB61F7|nr:aquaporin [uncultured Hyphomonas sp.]